MVEETETTTKTIVSPAVEDLSRAVEQAVGKLSGERVRCVRVYGNFYRCNWWQSDSHDRAWSVATNRIVRSRFVRATLNENGLQIEGMSEG